MADPYLQGNGVLRNALGITDRAALQRAEDEAVLIRIQTLLHGAPGTTGDVGSARGWGLDRLKAIHGHLFGGLYDWAGTTRAEPFVDSATGRSVGTGVHLSKDRTEFAAPKDVASSMAAVEARIAARDGLRGMKRSDFVVEVADILNDLNRAHPFREGNGRAQRAFLTGLARSAGRDLDFSGISRERMTRASVAGLAGDPNPLRRLVRDAATPERVARLKAVKGFMDRNGLDWDATYVGHVEPGRETRGEITGLLEDEFLMSEGRDVIVGRERDLPPGTEPGRGPVGIVPRGKPTAHAAPRPQARGGAFPALKRRMGWGR